MKIKDIKHDHSLTDLLKVLLFSILMLAPILAIGVKCAYVVVNKNAKDSYGGTQVLNETSVNNANMLLPNYEYNLNILTFIQETDSQQSGKSPTFVYSNEIDWTLYQSNLTDDILENTNAFFIQRANLNYLNITLFNNTTQLFVISGHINNTWKPMLTNGKELIHIDLVSVNDNGNFYNSYLQQITYYKPKLDNVFYYAIDEVAQEPLFNWTQNTAIYTGVNAMCTGIEITSPIIPILITYWFLLTCIYVIIDILIKGFTMLTHLIGSKLA